MNYTMYYFSNGTRVSSFIKFNKREIAALVAKYGNLIKQVNCKC